MCFLPPVRLFRKPASNACFRPALPFHSAAPPDPPSPLHPMPREYPSIEAPPWGQWACAPPQKGYLYRSYHDGATSQSLFWAVPVMSKVSSLPTTSPPVQRRTFHSIPAPLRCSAVDMLHRGMYLSESLHALLEYLERHIGVSEIPDSCPYLYSAFAIRNLVRSASFFPLFPLISGT